MLSLKWSLSLHFRAEHTLKNQFCFRTILFPLRLTMQRQVVGASFALFQSELQLCSGKSLCVTWCLYLVLFLVDIQDVDFSGLG